METHAVFWSARQRRPGCQLGPRSGLEHLLDFAIRHYCWGQELFLAYAYAFCVLTVLDDFHNIIRRAFQQLQSAERAATLIPRVFLRQSCCWKVCCWTPTIETGSSQELGNGNCEGPEHEGPSIDATDKQKRKLDCAQGGKQLGLSTAKRSQPSHSALDKESVSNPASDPQRALGVHMQPVESNATLRCSG